MQGSSPCQSNQYQLRLRARNVLSRALLLQCPRIAVGQTHEPRLSSAGHLHVGQEHGYQLGDGRGRCVRQLHLQSQLVRHELDARPLRFQCRAHSRTQWHVGCPDAEIVLRTRALAGGWMGTGDDLHSERRRAVHANMGDRQRPREYAQQRRLRLSEPAWRIRMQHSDKSGPSRELHQDGVLRVSRPRPDTTFWTSQLRPAPRDPAQFGTPRPDPASPLNASISEATRAAIS